MVRESALPEIGAGNPSSAAPSSMVARGLHAPLFLSRLAPVADKRRRKIRMRTHGASTVKPDASSDQQDDSQPRQMNNDRFYLLLLVDCIAHAVEKTPLANSHKGPFSAFGPDL